MRYSAVRSIRTHLILLVLVSVLPAIGVTIHRGVELQRRDIIDAQSKSLGLLRELAHSHEDIVLGTRTLLATLSRLTEVQNNDASTCTKLFRELQEQNPLYASIFAASAEGKVFANSVPFSPHTIRQRRYYQDVVRRRQFSVGEYVEGISLKKPVIHFAYPVQDSAGRLKGVVVVAVDLDRYGEAFSARGMPDDSVLAITDRNHTRVYRYPDSQKYVGRLDSPEMISHMSTPSGEGVFTGMSAEGVKRIYAYKKFYLNGETSPYLYMRVSVSEERALASARRTIFASLVLSLAAFIAALACAWIIGGMFIARQVRGLVDASHRLGSGDLTARTGLRHNASELGQLAAAFDGMADMVATREVSLREREETLQAFFEAVHESMFLIDSRGTVLLSNTVGAERLGRTVPELVGTCFYDHLPSDVARHRKKHYEEVVRTGKAVYFEDSRLGRFFQQYCFPLFDEEAKVSGVAICAHETTERKRAEEAMQKSEERYRRLFDDAILGVFRVTVGGRLITANPALIRMFGYQPEDNLVATVSDVASQFYAEPSRRTALIKMIEDAEERVRIENLFKRKDGSIFIGNVHAWKADEANGDAILEGFVEDITERKQAEEAVKTSLKEKEVLLKEVHHRVKNNLQIISSLLNMQSRRIGDPKDLEAFRASIDRVKSMALIHERLYRSESLASIDFPDYVKALADSLFYIHSLGKDIKMNVDVAPIALDIDTAIPLGLIINELASNSLKHAFPGGRGGLIAISLREEADTIVLVISDNGTGFPEDMDFMDTPSLGMQLVVTLVEQLEGTITLHRDEGTEFRITFQTAG